MSLIVVGLGVTGRAVVRAARTRGLSVTAADDLLTDDHVELLHGLGGRAVPFDGLNDEFDDACAVVVSPGLPDAHPIFERAAAAGVPVIDEFDLAAEWDDRPLAAVTGTNGKTTVTTWVTAMLNRSGITAVAAGNTELPLVAAIDDPATDVFVVEASSFRLGHSRRFRPSIATWLNFAPDHLDIHSDLEHYERAKAAIWDHAEPATRIIANAADPVVMRNLPSMGVVETFGDPTSPHRVDGSMLVVDDQPLCAVADLPRALPHDLENSLASAATALAAGATREAIRQILVDPPRLAHRVSFVGEVAGVSFYDDSKATVPQATIAAVNGFDSVVLIAGGRNKGLDLGDLASVADRLRAVIAIGEAADEIVAAFDKTDIKVLIGENMDTAVRRAFVEARPDDAVLLSPACASFDWYRDYGQRGDDFIDAVVSLANDDAATDDAATEERER